MWKLSRYVRSFKVSQQVAAVFFNLVELDMLANAFCLASVYISMIYIEGGERIV